MPAILVCLSWPVPPPEPRCARLRPSLPAQAELPFADVDPSQSGPGEPRWLPLYGWKGSGKTAKKVDAGEICVQAWFEAGGRERPGEDVAGMRFGSGQLWGSQPRLSPVWAASGCHRQLTSGPLPNAGGSALSTLCCQPGTRKHVPLVVHSSQGSLYEVRRVRVEH